MNFTPRSLQVRCRISVSSEKVNQPLESIHQNGRLRHAGGDLNGSQGSVIGGIHCQPRAVYGVGRDRGARRRGCGSAASGLMFATGRSCNDRQDWHQGSQASITVRNRRPIRIISVPSRSIALGASPAEMSRYMLPGTIRSRSMQAAWRRADGDAAVHRCSVKRDKPRCSRNKETIMTTPPAPRTR